MNKHTPGPWSHDEIWGLISTENGAEICALHSGNVANARLIAAAPDMLDELRRAQGELATALRDGAEHLTPDMLRRWFNGVSAAIAKAEG
jgi:hypothetical protein